MNVNGNLFHTCGGHVFNSKRQDVLDYFWSFFNQDDEFTKADRNSVVFFSNEFHVPYPIENHAYFFDDRTIENIIDDIIKMFSDKSTPRNFEEFLIGRFGKTLYELYFCPYNQKIWKCDLSDVSLTWLEGKLPMPTPQEILFNNIKKVEEKKFVHSSFWYEKKGGSQFIADRFAQGLNIRYSSEVQNIERVDNFWYVNGDSYDIVVFCGNIKELPSIMPNCSQIEKYASQIENLKYHGTTSVFCEIDANPYSWIYLPNSNYDAHRIICTGNFSKSNNAINSNRITGTIEFTDFIDEGEILLQLKDIPLNPYFLTKKFNKYTYPIQDNNTRSMLRELKNELQPLHFYTVGRFADWEYYNMDVAIGAAMNLSKEIKM